MQRTASRKIEYLVVFLVVLAVLVAGVVFMRAYPVYTTTSDVVVPKVVEGSHLPPLPGYPWGSHPQTLVLALRVGCPYCEASMEFYERLYTLEKRKQITAHVLVVFNDPAAEVRKEMPEPLRELPTLSSVDFGRLSIGATPTVLLINSNGVAQKIWRGQLSPELENQLLSAVQSQNPER